MPLTTAQLDALSILKKANHVLVLPSSPIDGDSIGSALSLYLALQKLGKKVTVVAEEAIPPSYNFLPKIAAISRELHFVRECIVTIDCRDKKPGNVRHEIQGNKINIIVTPTEGSIARDQVSFVEGGTTFDAIVTVDAADPSQFGKIYDNATELFHLVPVINIDHHVSNVGFGKINVIDVMAASTTTLILPLIEELEKELRAHGASAQDERASGSASARESEPTNKELMDADIATLLLAGLITDTGSFQNPNTTPDAFAIAAKLISYGARQQEIIRNIYKTKKLSTLRLWGRTLTKIQFDEQHRLVWSVLTAKDFAELGGSPDETEGVIDELMSNAPGAEIIFLLKEKGPQEVGGSIRTITPLIDASKLAMIFGGGGHMQAAGFQMKGKSIVEAEQIVVGALRDSQKKRLGQQAEPQALPLKGITQTAGLVSAPSEPQQPRNSAPTPSAPTQLPPKPQAPRPIQQTVVPPSFVPQPPRPVSAPIFTPAPTPLPPQPIAPQTQQPIAPAPRPVAPTTPIPPLSPAPRPSSPMPTTPFAPLFPPTQPRPAAAPPPTPFVLPAQPQPQPNPPPPTSPAQPKPPFFSPPGSSFPTPPGIV